MIDYEQVENLRCLTSLDGFIENPGEELDEMVREEETYLSDEE